MNTAARRDADPERLPWLESAEPEKRRAPQVPRTLVMVLVGITAAAGLAFASFGLREMPESEGTGDVIAADAGPYKTRPTGTDGMQVAGQADTAIATSEGAAANATLNLTATPENPMDANSPDDGGAAAAPWTDTALPADMASTGTGRVEAAVPTAAPRLRARAPASAAPVAAAAGAGGLAVQLGSFPNESQANAAWNDLSRRVSYLAPLVKSVQPATVGGRTVYRLRVDAGGVGGASALCGKLKLAGEKCFVAP